MKQAICIEVPAEFVVQAIRFGLDPEVIAARVLEDKARKLAAVEQVTVRACQTADA